MSTSRGVVVLAALATCGCAYRGTARQADPALLTPDAGWTLIRSVPVVLQEDQQDCGAAALAMLLTHSGDPRDLKAVLAR